MPICRTFQLLALFPMSIWNYNSSLVMRDVIESSQDLHLTGAWGHYSVRILDSDQYKILEDNNYQIELEAGLTVFCARC